MIQEIIKLFPTPVARYKFYRSFNETELNLIQSTPRHGSMFLEEDKSFLPKQRTNCSSINSEILEEIELQEIKKFLLDCCNDYLIGVYKPSTDIKIKITQSWLNFTQHNQFHNKHSHPNSFISGVLYINAEENIDEIGFVRDGHPFPNNFIISPPNSTEYVRINVNVPVKTGELLLFPSTLVHYVPPLKSNSTRISLSFNTFLSGTLGDKNSLCELKL